MARKQDKTTTVYINVANSVLVAPSEDGGKVYAQIVVDRGDADVAGDFLLASLQVHDQGHAYAAVRALIADKAALDKLIQAHVAKGVSHAPRS